MVEAIVQQGHLRQGAIMLNLVLQLGDLLHNLLALGLFLLVINLCDGAVDVVDGLGLRGRQRRTCAGAS
jgi:membrane protein required for beta-lactamase induction